MTYSVSMAVGDFFGFLGEVTAASYDEAVKLSRKLCKARGVINYRLSGVANDQPQHALLAA